MIAVDFGARLGAFDALCSEVAACEKCPRMSQSARVLNRGSGPVSARIMFIGEAPGRLGADESGIPFHGDTSGHNFEELLTLSGLTRAEIFVTNAALCNPRDAKGNNAPPSPEEIANCSGYLRRQLELVDPAIVVTLGASALRAACLVEPHSLSLQRNVRTATSWFGRILIPLYHPGQRAMIHRSLTNQKVDYQFVAERFRRLGKPTSQVSGRPKLDVARAALAIVSKTSRISYFALHKLLFLAEVEFRKRHGKRLTCAFFIRQKDGPYCVDLHPRKLVKAIPWMKFTSASGHLVVSLASPDLFGLHAGVEKGSIADEASEAIESVVCRYRSVSDSQLKTAVYLTAPMKSLLREEKRAGVLLINAPIDLNQVRGSGPL